MDFIEIVVISIGLASFNEKVLLDWKEAHPNRTARRDIKILVKKIQMRAPQSESQFETRAIDEHVS